MVEKRSSEASKRLAEWVKSLRWAWAVFLEGLGTLVRLLVDVCDVCESPVSVLWFQVGNHEMCDRLEVHNCGNLAGQQETPPFQGPCPGQNTEGTE